MTTDVHSLPGEAGLFVKGSSRVDGITNRDGKKVREVQHSIEQLRLAKPQPLSVAMSGTQLPLTSLPIPASTDCHSVWHLGRSRLRGNLPANYRHTPRVPPVSSQKQQETVDI